MRIVIVEDQRMFLEAVKKACVGEFGHEVVGEATTGAAAVDVIFATNPEVVVLDLSLPDMDGLTVIERVRAQRPEVRILILSCHCDDYTMFRVEKVGVCGFVDKNAHTLDALREALDAVAAGRSYYSAAYHIAKTARLADPHSFAKLISDREMSVLSLIGEAKDDDEIGRRLGISARTASTHRSNLLRKLGLKNTPKLIAFARDRGFTTTATEET